MPDLEFLQSLAGTAGGGAVLWVVIKAEIKLLWREHGRLERRLDRIEDKKAA